VSRYQKGKTDLDFAEARDSEWQWNPQVCTSLQTDNHASTPPLSFLQAGCPSCRPTNSVKALRQYTCKEIINIDALKVICTNKNNGLLNKRQDLKLLIQCLPEPPDVIAVTEFKPKKIAHHCHQLLISS